MQYWCSHSAQLRRLFHMALETNRVATLLENLEKSGKIGKIREKSGKMNYYNYSVATIIVQTEICNIFFYFTFPAKVSHIYNNSLLRPT